MTKRIAIQKNQIGLIVRGMLNPDHNPSVFAQHADCILPDGSPIGFFGEGPGQASGGSGSSMSLGLGMAGVVFDYARMKEARFAYVNPVRAKQEGVFSTVLILDTTEEAAERLPSTGGPRSSSRAASACWETTVRPTRRMDSKRLRS